MKIIQILTTISMGDAVSNDTLAICNIIKEMGYQTAIYAEFIDDRLPKKTAQVVEKLKGVEDDDIIIYHLSTGTELNYRFGELPGRKIVIYHNITPSAFFDGYSDKLRDQCQYGIDSVKALADKVEYCICDSQFNKLNLIDMGYKCPIDVVPIIIPFEDYEKQPSEEIISRYLDDGYTNVLFTGRIAPNKKQEDVIGAFYFYQKYYNPKSRLFLIGSQNENERYAFRLQSYINALGVENVELLGHVSFADILAYYRCADIFLCQSEHEGFCVPLAEAMFFKVPIVAYDAAAIKWTLGGSGILLDKKNRVETAGVINRLVTDEELRTKVINNEQDRLNDFNYEKVSKEFKQCLNKFIEMK